jgi:hypothetical protein
MRNYLLNWAKSRNPDFVIGGNERPYLLRWWVIPRNPVFNVYLHCFLRSDDDRALHTHPWLFNVSWLLLGKYREWFNGEEFSHGREWIKRERAALVLPGQLKLFEVVA